MIGIEMSFPLTPCPITSLYSPTVVVGCHLGPKLKVLGDRSREFVIRHDIRIYVGFGTKRKILTGDRRTHIGTPRHVVPRTERWYHWLLRKPSTTSPEGEWWDYRRTPFTY